MDQKHIVKMGNVLRHNLSWEMFLLPTPPAQLSIVNPAVLGTFCVAWAHARSVLPAPMGEITAQQAEAHSMHFQALLAATLCGYIDSVEFSSRSPLDGSAMGDLGTVWQDLNGHWIVIGINSHKFSTEDSARLASAWLLSKRQQRKI